MKQTKLDNAKTDPSPQLQNPPANHISSEVYSSLRDEVLKRIEIRYQILNFALVGSGAILTFGLAEKSSISLFAYSLLGAGLAFAWQDNHNWIRTISSYLESEMIPWEVKVKTYKETIQESYRKPLGMIGIGLILVGTQVVTFAAGLVVWLVEPEPLHPIKWLPIILSLSIIIMTIYMFYINKKDANINESYPHPIRVLLKRFSLFLKRFFPFL